MIIAHIVPMCFSQHGTCILSIGIEESVPPPPPGVLPPVVINNSLTFATPTLTPASVCLSIHYKFSKIHNTIIYMNYTVHSRREAGV